jgi:hypothetical protein
MGTYRRLFILGKDLRVLNMVNDYSRGHDTKGGLEPLHTPFRWDFYPLGVIHTPLGYFIHQGWISRPYQWSCRNHYEVSTLYSSQDTTHGLRLKMNVFATKYAFMVHGSCIRLQTL